MFKLNFTRWIDYNTIVKNRAISLYKSGLDEIIEEKLVPVIRKSANEKDRKLRFCYYLKDSIYNRPLFYYDYTENQTISSCRCDLCKTSNQCHHIIFGMMKEKNYDEEMIENLFIQEEERINEKLLEEKRKEYLVKLNPLLDEFSEYDQLSLLNPVDIELYFETAQLKKGVNTLLLSFKIGNDKKYVVKDVEEFLVAVKNQEVVSYGQKLSFKHSLENFTEKGRKILSLLIKAYVSTPNYSFYNIYEKKHIKVNEFMLDEILEICQNSVVKLYNEDYIVSLDEINLRFRLNKKYVLEIEGFNPDTDYIFIGKEQCYLFTDSEVYLMKLSQNDLLPLLKFVIKNPNFSFKYTKDILTKDILSRFYQEIEIDEKIKDEFKVKEYKIEAYFDFDNDFIKVESKYYCGDELITDINNVDKKEVISRKIAKYLHVLTALGFNEKGYLDDPLKIKVFLTTDLSSLKEVADIYLSERIKRTQIKQISKVRMNISYNVNFLEINVESDTYSDEDLYKIIKAIRKKTKYVKLSDNVIIEIDDETANELLTTVDEFGLDAHHLTKSQKVPSYLALKLADRNLDVVPYEADENFSKMIEDIANYKNALFLPPESLKDIMREYQITAFKWMKTLIKYGFSGILADDMGLGKTLEMISVILDSDIEKPVLIVCPKSLCYNWKNEFDKWTPSLKVVNVIGSIVEREQRISDIKNDKKVIYITSYDSLRNDIALYENKEFSFIILDEAQYIKNHGTQKAQSVKLLKSIHRFVLTGTPIENSVIDLWSIFDFLLPNYLGSYNDFKHANEQKITVDNDKKVITRLVKKITPFILRRTKKDVIKDLPDKVETMVSATMGAQQKALYDAELLFAKNMLSTADSQIAILAAITRLRQICVDPELFVENYTGGSAKIEQLMEMIDENIKEKHRIIVFSQFTSVFNKISNLLNNKKIKHFILTGKTPSKERLELAEEFNNNENIKVFLVSLKAGGTGLNLVGADIVIHLDPWWNVAAENQATDRAHRIGQKRIVQVIKLICDSTIEQKVIELQNRKSEVVKQIVADDDSLIQKLTADDLKFILE